MGFDWSIVSPYVLSGFYAGSTSFAREGVKVSYINTSSPIYNSDNSGIAVGDLLLSCVVTALPSTYTGPPLLTNISFGNQTTQRTPGLLIYYPVDTQVVFSYRKAGDTAAARQTTITLNTTYVGVDNYKDGPLQGINRTNTINRKLTNHLPVVSE